MQHWASHIRGFGLLAAVTVAGATALGWPLYAPASGSLPFSAAAVLTLVILPITVGLFINELIASHMSIKTLAIAGIVIALAAAVRPLGAGVGGIEPMWLILIVAGRVFGASAGFVIGASAIFISALLTGGLGPWLPYQLVCAGWIAMGAGLLPVVHGKREVLLLMVYGSLSTFLYGWAMNLWFWQNLQGLDPALGYHPAAVASERVAAWIRFNLATSFAFDAGRAVFTAVLLAIGAAPLLSALRRAHRSYVVAGLPTSYLNSP